VKKNAKVAINPGPILFNISFEFIKLKPAKLITINGATTIKPMVRLSPTI